MSNLLGGLPIGVGECLKPGSSWAFSDTYLLRACLPPLSVFLLCVDYIALQAPPPPQDAGDQDALSPAPGTTTDGAGFSVQQPQQAQKLPPQQAQKPPLFFSQRLCINSPRGTREGYDRSMYSTSFLSWSAGVFFTSALASFACKQTDAGLVLYYENSQRCSIENPLQIYAVIFMIVYIALLVWFYVFPVLHLHCRHQFCRVPFMVTRSQPRADTATHENLDAHRASVYEDPSLLYTNVVQQLISLLGNFAVLGPQYAVGMSALLLFLSLFELVLYVVLVLRSFRRGNVSSAPFNSPAEQCIYFVQMFLVSITHSVGLACARNGCDPKAASTWDKGVALIVLHGVFAVAFFVQLFRLLCYPHETQAKCGGTTGPFCGTLPHQNLPPQPLLQLNLPVAGMAGAAGVAAAAAAPAQQQNAAQQLPPTP